MSAKFSSIALSALLAVGVTLGPGVQAASADVVTISHTFSGFEFEKTALSVDMKTAIQAWLALNPDFTQVSCFGFTGYNVSRRSSGFMKKLAITRAKNSCNFIKLLQPGVRILSTGGVPSSSQNPNSRRVTITLSRNGSLPTGGGGGTGDGNGGNTVGTCDNNIIVKMRSRLFKNDLYFAQMALSDISLNCKGKQLDVYLTDASGTELGHCLNKPVTGTTLTLNYTDFSYLEIKSTTVDKVAFSVHD
jgi:hypothetical protein